MCDPPFLPCGLFTFSGSAFWWYPGKPLPIIPPDYLNTFPNSFLLSISLTSYVHTPLHHGTTNQLHVQQLASTTVATAASIALGAWLHPLHTCVIPHNVEQLVVVVLLLAAYVAAR